MNNTFKERREAQKRRRALYVRGLPPDHVDPVPVEPEITDDKKVEKTSKSHQSPSENKHKGKKGK